MNDRSNNWIVLETSLGSTKKINRKNSPITNKTRNIWKYEFRPIFSSLWVSQTCSTVDSIRKDLKLTLKLNFLFRFWSLAQLAHLERQYFSLKSFCFDSDKILNDSKSENLLYFSEYNFAELIKTSSTAEKYRRFWNLLVLWQKSEKTLNLRGMNFIRTRKIICSAGDEWTWYNR